MAVRTQLLPLEKVSPQTTCSVVFLLQRAAEDQSLQRQVQDLKRPGPLKPCTRFKTADQREEQVHGEVKDFYDPKERVCSPVLPV